MEFKINFIFIVVLIFTILCSIYFISELIKAISEEEINKKYHKEKLYCHHCRLAYTTNKYIATHYKYCPECGEELQYFDEYKDSNQDLSKENNSEETNDEEKKI